MNLNNLLPLAQIDTSYAEKHQRTGNFMQEGYWFPEQASDFAARSDYLFMAITWISVVFFAIIVFFTILFCWQYRRRPGVDPQPSSSHNTNLEIFWSVIPSIILVWIFYVGASGWFDMRVATDDAEEIYVTASRWNWSFRYPNGDTSNELHLVQDKPVKLIMQSTDVLHSLFVSAFRQKVDIVPGRYTYAFIKPTKIGKYRLACTEYCGTEHSRMRTLCQVHESSAARQSSTEWIRAEYPPWETGKRLVQMNCSGCHKMDGNAATGPALNLVWTKGEEDLIGGEKVKVDENYVRESILYPDKKIVEGYGPVSKMNSFDGKLTPQQIDDLIAYIKYENDPEQYGSPKTAAELEAEMEGKKGPAEEPAADTPANPATDETPDQPQLEPATEDGDSK